MISGGLRERERERERKRKRERGGKGERERERGYMPLAPSLGGVACASIKYGRPNTEGA